jgi:hypothetical protein
MPLNTSTLRPGFIVTLRTSVRGNVRYAKEIIESAHTVDGEVHSAPPQRRLEIGRERRWTSS